LTGLPLNTNQQQLQDFLSHIKAKSCFIPRDQQYRLRPYAFINFASLDDLDAAAAQSQKFKERSLFWMDPSAKHCHSCGAPGHEFKDCSNRKPVNPYKPLYERFKPEQYRPPRTFNKNNPNNPSFAHIINNQKPPNTKDSPKQPQNVIDALKLVQERLDSIDVKLLAISDEIKAIKTDIAAHEENENDIGFRLNRL